jgi:hypothetical protein
VKTQIGAPAQHPWDEAKQKAAATPVAPSPALKPFVSPAPDTEGRVPLVVIRPGIEIEGQRPRTGEKVFLLAAQAEAFVRAGAADYATEGAL